MRVAAVSILAMIACGKESTGPREAAKAAVRESLVNPALGGAGQAVVVKPLPPTAEVAGPAFLWIDHVGLATIDKGTATLERFTDPGPMWMYVKAMALGGGDPVMLADPGPFRIAAHRREDLAKPPENLYGARRLAVAPDGTVWVGNEHGLARWRDGAWTSEHVEVDDLESIDFDGAGHVFVTGRERVMVLDGDVWKTVVDTRKLAQSPERPWWQQTIVTPTGELWVIGCWHLLRISDRGVTAIDLPEPGFSHGRFVGSTLVGVSCFNNTLVHLSLSGVLGEVTPAPHIQGFTRAVDGRGRLWVADQKTGLTVISPDGSRVSMPVGSWAALDGDVAAVAIAGTGPDSFPAPTPDLHATISGYVLDHGLPVPDAPVELCRTPLMPEPSPCANDPSRLTGTTDANGAFHIRSPLGSMEVVAKAHDHWYALMNHECTGMLPDGVCEIGTIELTKAIDPNQSSMRFVINHTAADSDAESTRRRPD